MSESIRNLMSSDVVAVEASQSVEEAAQCMRDSAIGDVLVTAEGKLYGIITDRDIVIRCVAEGLDPAETLVRDVCSRELHILRPDDDVGAAVSLVKSAAVRRIPVVATDGRAVGVVSLGDLAMRYDADSALGRLSAAPPTS